MNYYFIKIKLYKYAPIVWNLTMTTQQPLLEVFEILNFDPFVTFALLSFYSLIKFIFQGLYESRLWYWMKIYKVILNRVLEHSNGSISITIVLNKYLNEFKMEVL